MKALANIEAEQVVLATLLNDPKSVHFSQMLNIDDFTDKSHRLIFEAFDGAAREGRHASPIVLSPQFERDRVTNDLTVAQYMRRLGMYVTRRECMPDYIRALKELSGKRMLGQLSTAMAETAQSSSAALATFVEDAVGTLDEMLSGLRRQRVTSFMAGELAEQAVAKLRSGDKPHVIDTGLKDLNKALGGFNRGNLIILAGRPSMGKTTVAVSAMRQAAKRGVSALMFSQEMPGEEVMFRFLSDAVYNSQTPIQYERMVDATVTPWEVERLEEAAQGIARLPIRIDEQSSLSVSEIGVRARRYAEQLASEGKRLDVIWIDHLGFIQASSRYAGNKVYEISDITKTFRGLAKELDVAIVLLCQLNRGVQHRESKRPQLQDLRDSGAIEEDADVVLFVYREYYYLSRMEADNDNEKEAQRKAKMEMMENIIEIICDKRRNGAIFNKRFFADMGSNTIRDLAA